MTPRLEALLARAQTWAEGDIDEVTRSLVWEAIHQKNEERLRHWFAVPLSFGTAGLRGPVGPGPGCLNLALMAKLGWAVGAFLSSAHLARRGVVVGFDARPDSARFAHTLAAALGSRCERVWLFPEAQPTPLVAQACRQLHAGAALVVTASHNPAGDNGVKLYDAEGIQIVAPWDEAVELSLSRAPAACDVPLRAAAISPVPAEVVNAYFGQLRAQARLEGSRKFVVAYTPVHGVGLAAVRRALAAAPIELLAVPSQAVPDGTFPGMPFPNPEEPGVLDQLLELARHAGAELAVANDPDADRAAAALPSSEGGWVVLSGDELGLLLADYALQQSQVEQPVVVSSIVSSPSLDGLLAQAGGRVVRTLTGFKWIARVLNDEPASIFGYEEALGYCFKAPAPDLSPLDKDGIAAVVQLCSLLLIEGSGVALLSRLQRLFERVGLWASQGESVRFTGEDPLVRAAQAMDHLRSFPPETLGGALVTAVTDFAQGAAQRPPYLGAQDLVVLDAGGACRVLVRPSGTEPKVKIYVHVRQELAQAEEFLPQREAARSRAHAIAREVAGRLVPPARALAANPVDA